MSPEARTCPGLLFWQRRSSRRAARNTWPHARGCPERAERGAAPDADVSRGARLVAEARLHQLRRAGRADRRHAPGAGRAAPLDLGTPLPARARLLHGAAGTGGAAAGDLHRLADAQDPRRNRRRRPVRPAVARDPDRVVLGLPGAWRRAGDRRRVLRHQAGSRRDRRLRRLAARVARARQRLGWSRSPSSPSSPWRSWVRLSRSSSSWRVSSATSEGACGRPRSRCAERLAPLQGRTPQR